MADAGKVIGQIAIAGMFAFDQHTIEIVQDRVEPHQRWPNKAVPTRTWVAPSITAVS
jgi:hypothetical protein